MTEPLVMFLYGAVVLALGVFLSAAFAGISNAKKNLLSLFGFFALCGAFQATILLFFSESLVWKLYPLISHLPLVLFFRLKFKKRVITAISAVCTSYLCCQPSKWFGILVFELTQNKIYEVIARICVILIVFFVGIKFFAPYLSQIFNKPTNRVVIFGMVPFIYYIFDYMTVIYTSFWLDNNRIVAEFPPFFLCVVFMVFCLIYYKEYERKADAERKEQMIRITVAQQAKELEAIKKGQSEMRMLRHDLRLFLSTLAVCIETDEKETVRDMITSYASHIDGTKVVRFCASDTVNYVLSDFDAKCQAKGVKFAHTVELGELCVDEITFSSILSNALDNALNAVMDLPDDSLYIRLMLKNSDGHILLSVRNPIGKPPIFSDGMPVSTRKGHGYGTQSIKYMAERLGGNCQFTVQNGIFVTRVII